MRTKAGALWLATFIGCVGGCGAADVCEEAVDKLVGECGLGAGAGIDGTISECKDLVECRAECVVESDCEDIAEAKDDYADCLGDC